MIRISLSFISGRIRVFRILGLVLAGVALVAAAFVSRAPSSWQGEAALAELDRRGDTESLREAYKAARYAARPVDGRAQAFASLNAAQDFRAEFDLDAVTLTSPGARVVVRAVGVGYGESLQPMPATGIIADGTRVEIARATTGTSTAITEWWVNRPAGLEQGYTVNSAPGRRNDGDWLRVAFATEGDLRPIVAADSQTALLENADGQPMLRYDHLHVTDATGRRLPSRMTATGAGLALETDDANAVYPITIDPTWAQEAYLKASNTDPGDLFGRAVAVSGNTVVIAAASEDSAATGVNGNHLDNSASNSGAAYVFVRTGTTWTQQAYLKASNTQANDNFGVSVAISGDTIVVGADAEDSSAIGIDGNGADNSASAAGAAYVFFRSGTVWTQQAYLKASNTETGDNFGRSVSVDVDTVVVGAPGEASAATGINGSQVSNAAAGAGAAYIFVRSGSVWTQQAYAKASNTASGDGYGYAVSVSLDTIVVGASGEDSIATGVNGNQADDTASASGAAYVLTRSGAVWTQQAYLKASNTGGGDSFGSAVAVSGDTVVVGAGGEDGSSNVVNGGSDEASSGAGAAYVFTRSGAVWTPQAYLKAFNSTGSQSFGYAVAVSGTNVVVGAPQESFFATGVNGIITGNSSFSGAAYVFAPTAGVWSQQSYVKASNTGSADLFGEGVAVSGSLVIVGADTEDSAATGVNGDQSSNAASNAGAVYAYDLGGTITGTVTNAATLAPVSNVTVAINSSAGIFVATTVTDASGVYTSPGLLPGSYFVKALPSNTSGLVGQQHNNVPCPQGTCPILSGSPVVVTVPNATNINFALQQGGSFTGTITNAATLAPVSSVNVAFYSLTGSLIASATTNASGVYTSPALTTGSYVVRALPATGSNLLGQLHNGLPCPLAVCTLATGTPVALTAPNNTLVNFALAPGGNITGTITNAATLAPVANVTVTIYSSAGTSLATATTNASGVYTTAGLATGSYMVRAVPLNSSGLAGQLYSNLPCPNGSCVVTTGTAVPVTAPNSTQINFALQQGARITGTVTSAATALPVQSVTVQFYSSTGVSVGSTTTDAAGVYSSAPLTTGSYVVRADPPASSGLLGRLYNNLPCPNTFCTVAAGTPVTVTTPTDTSNINFALPPGGTITGTITHATTGAAVSGVTVTFYNNGGTSVASTTTTSTGSYTSPGLPAGQYFVRAIPLTSSGLVGEQHNDLPCPGGSCATTSGNLVTVTAQNATPVNFALSPGGTITGTVTNATTLAPVPSVAVVVFNSVSAQIASLTTDGLGVYTSPVLPTGSYFVRAVPAATTGLVAQLYSNVDCPTGVCTISTGTAVAVTSPNAATANFALTPGATITGTVTNATTLAPVGNVTVRIYSSTGSSMATVLTDAQGAYASAGLSTGTYYVRAEPAQGTGLVWQMYNNVSCPAGTCTVLSSAPVVVSAPNPTPVNFALQPGASIRGTVTNATTLAPVAGATVAFYLPSSTAAGTATTDALGQYVSPALATGSYFIRAIPPSASGLIGEQYNNLPCPGGSCLSTSGTAVAVNAPNDTVIDFALEPGATISGTVTNAATLEPVGGASVRIYSGSGLLLGTVTTNAQGVYTSLGLTTGPYFVRVEPLAASGLVAAMYDNVQCAASGCGILTGTPVMVTAPVATPNINVALAPGGVITGTITNATTLEPVAGVSVSFFSAAGVSIGSVSANALGAYTSQVLPAGSYFVSANPPIATGLSGQLHNNIPCPGFQCTTTTGDLVSVSVSNATVVDFALQAGSTISGTVTHSVTGLPVASVSVTVFSATGTNLSSVTTNAQGVYTTSAWPTGTYFVRAVPPAASGLVGELYDNRPCPGGSCITTNGQAVGVTTPNNTTNINFALSPGATISGTVTNAVTLAPVAGASVTVFTATGGTVVTLTTDANGNYTSAGVATGSYFVRALPPAASGLIGELHNNLPCPGGACTVTTGLPVAVTAPSPTTNINFALDPGGTITGVVTHAVTQVPLAGVSVTIFTSTGTSTGVVTTDVLGAYTSAILPNGSYFVRAVPPAAYGLLAQVHSGVPCPLGTCAATVGTPVPVTSPGATQVNFALALGGTVAGTVRNAATQQPLENVSVGFFTPGGVLATTVTTNAQGQYLSPVVGSGSLFVRAVPPGSSGVIGQVYDGLPCAFGSCVVTNGTPVVVTAPNSTPINFDLAAGAAITGTVTNANTLAPVSGATVQFFTSSGTSVGTALTNGLGAYTSPGLPSGSYFVRLTPPLGSSLIGELHPNMPCPGGTCTPTAGALVAVVEPNATVVDFALETGATLTGTVTNATTGAPVANVSVQFTVSGVFSVGTATTDAQGVYTSWALPTGSYRIRALPTTASGLIGQNYNGVPCPGGSCHALTGTLVPVVAPNATVINFALQPGATITGKVTNATTLAPVGTVAMAFFSNTGLSVGTVNTDAGGSYTSPGLPSGSYFVRALPGATTGLVGEVYGNLVCPNGACNVTKGTPVVVTSPDLTPNIDFALEVGATISGTIVAESTLAPVLNVNVAFFDSTGASVGSTTSSVFGTYVSPALPSGSYYVRALPPGTTPLVGELYNDLPCPAGGCDETTGTAVAVTAPNMTPDIDFALRDGATIEGVVTHANTAAPVNGVNVAIYSSTGALVGSTNTDLQGAYSSGGLPAGSYFVIATPPAASGLVGQLHNGLPCPGGGCLATIGTPVVVAGQVASVVNFALTPGGTISGLVTRASNGEPLSSVQMRFFSSTTAPAGTVSTTAQGTYVSHGLPDGSYYVQTFASALSGLVSQMYNNVICAAGLCALDTGTPVPVTAPNATTGINFAMPSTPVAPNNSYASATVIGSVPYQTTVDASGATAGAEDPAVTCGPGYGGFSVWYVYTPTVDGPIGFNTFGSNYDTVLSVYTGSPGSFNPVDCNDDDGNIGQSSLTVQGLTGQALSILVTGPVGAGILVFNAITVPGAPTGVSAIPGNGQAIVSFAAPLSNGGSVITGYTVTASPGGATATGLVSPLVVNGLSNGTPYTFTATATNSVGTGPSSAPSSPVTPAVVVMTAAPASLRFAATKAGPGGALTFVTAPQVASVTFSSGAPTWTLSVDQPWVQLSTIGGTGAGQFTVSIINPGNVIGGSTSLTATISVTAAGASNTPQPITVTLVVDQNNSTSNTSFGQVDTPSQNASGVQGAIGVTGWALDNIGVAAVKLYRNCLGFENQANCQIVLGENLVYVGDATFVPGARPDVEAAFPTHPQNNRAGWGFLLLTSMLPHVPNQQPYGGQGPMTLYVVATDLEGNQSMIGRSSNAQSPDFTMPTSITMANDSIAKPFGAIDTPGQGQTISGVFHNFGWALTPDSNTTAGDPGDIFIPANGSTMTVFIDSLPVSLVAYNQCRGSVGNPVPPGVYCNDDVSNIFGNLTPQPVLTTRTSNPTLFRNLDAASAAIGAYTFDTALLSNGMHTIQWVVYDSQGRGEGIGSRFFSVLNAGSEAPLGATQAAAPPALSVPSMLATPAPAAPGVFVRTGFELAAAWQPLEANDEGKYAVRLTELGRLEIWLGEPVEAGHLLANDTLRPLPVGSSLTGSVFAWMPPAGYLGPYRLVFMRGGERIEVIVTVVEKGPVGVR